VDKPGLALLVVLLFTLVFAVAAGRIWAILMGTGGTGCQKRGSKPRSCGIISGDPSRWFRILLLRLGGAGLRWDIPENHSPPVFEGKCPS